MWFGAAMIWLVGRSRRGSTRGLNRWALWCDRETLLIMLPDSSVGEDRPISADRQARIYRFLEKTKKSRKKKSTTTENPDGQSDPTTSGECNVIEDSDKVVTEMDELRKKVENLLKKQKMRKTMALVKHFDASKPWGQEGQAKVGGHLIQLRSIWTGN